MSKTVQWKRGNANVSASYIGAQGEVTVDTSEWGLRVHDGITPGGYKITNDSDNNVNIANLNITDQTIEGINSDQDVLLVATGEANIVLFGQSTVVSNDIYVQGNGTIDGILIQNSTISTTDPAVNLVLTSGNVSTTGTFYANSLRLATENFYIADVYSGALSRNIVSIYSGLVSPQDITIRTNNSIVGLHSSLLGTVGIRTFASNTQAVTINGNTLVQGNITATAFRTDEYSDFAFVSNLGAVSGLRHRPFSNIGNINILAIAHDNFEVARFFSNGQTQLTGNLIVTGGLGVANQAVFPEARLQIYSNINAYSQIIHQNLNSGTLSSSDLVATANNGDDTTFYIDLGIAGNLHADPDFFGDTTSFNDGYLYVTGYDQAGPSTGNIGNLILGSTNGIVKVFVGNAAESNVVTVISSTGLIPGANVAYNLGSPTRQWKDLWLSNSTMYLGGVPITVTANGQLAVNGSVISGNAGGDYGNANVAAYLPTYTGNLSVGNIIMAAASTASKIQFKAAGNTNGAIIYDDSGSLILTPNTTYSPTAGVGIGGLGYLLAPNGSRNLTLNYGSVNGQVGVQTNLVVGTTLTGGNLTVANNIVASGNITGSYFIGNGALLTGISASGNYDNSNVVTLLSSFGSNTITTTGNITGANIIATANLLINGYGKFAGTFDESIGSNQGVVLGYAGGTPRILFGTGNTQQTFEIDNDGGTLRFYQPGSTKASLTSTGHFSATGNVTGGNLITTGLVNVTGNVSASYFIGNGRQLTGLEVGSNTQVQFNDSGSLGAINTFTFDKNGNVLTVGSATSSGTLKVADIQSVTGAIRLIPSSNVTYSYGNFHPLFSNTYDLGLSSNRWRNFFANTANVVSLSSSGNVTADYFIGNGALLTGISTGNYGDSNVATLLSNFGSNNISTTGNISGNTAGFSIGYRDIPQVVFTSNATLALTDAGKHYYSANSANVITVPNNATVSFNIGTAITVVQQGTSNLTITPDSGVTMYLSGNSTSAARTLGNYGMATLMKVATDTWFINGTGLA